MRSTLSLLLLILTLLPPIESQDTSTSIDYQLCNTGCLKCSTDGKCQFCDIQSDNFLKNDTCARFSINNCQEYTFNGDCKRCDSIFYLTEGVCEIIDESNRIPNCFTHSSPGICKVCTNDYILIQGECVAITTAKDNCVTYNDSGTLCTNCANYVLSTDFQSCNKNFELTLNCQ